MFRINGDLWSFRLLKWQHELWAWFESVYLQTTRNSQAPVRRLLSTKYDNAAVMSEHIDAVEDQLWEELTMSDFWHHLQLYSTAGIPMPMRHKLRLLTQVPHWVPVDALVHIFVEEDTIAALTNVRCQTMGLVM